MSTAGYLNERTVGAVLWLWRKPENTLGGLLRATLAPQVEVTTALEVLQGRKCLIERTPTEVRLVSTGLACWSDILEKTARSRPANWPARDGVSSHRIDERYRLAVRDESRVRWAGGGGG